MLGGGGFIPSTAEPESGSDDVPLPRVYYVFSGSCAVNLPGRIRWPEGMNPQARYVPPW